MNTGDKQDQFDYHVWVLIIWYEELLYQVLIFDVRL